MSMTMAELEAAIYRYVPSSEPDPKAYVRLVMDRALGKDKDGKDRSLEDVLYFLQVCARTELDPLSRQIYGVYRYDSKKKVDVLSIQVSIDGMRLIAHRTGLYAGQDDAVFTPEDVPGSTPWKATVTVYRSNPHTRQRDPITASARWDEYVQTYRDGNPMGMWASKPFTMLAKCAEALALRKAFPQELSGLYSEDEMAQADSGREPDPRTLWEPPKGEPAGNGNGNKPQPEPTPAPKAEKATVKPAVQKAEPEADPFEDAPPPEGMEEPEGDGTEPLDMGHDDKKPEKKAEPRPWEPNMLKHKIGISIAHYRRDPAFQKTASPDQTNYLAGLLNELFDVENRKLKDAHRHDLLQFLIGTETTKDMDLATFNVLMKWAYPDGAENPRSEDAAKEADAVWKLLQGAPAQA